MLAAVEEVVRNVSRERKRMKEREDVAQTRLSWTCHAFVAVNSATNDAWLLVKFDHFHDSYHVSMRIVACEH